MRLVCKIKRNKDSLHKFNSQANPTPIARLHLLLHVIIWSALITDPVNNVKADCGYLKHHASHHCVFKEDAN